MSEKEQAAAAILRAQTELERALLELEKLPAYDPGNVAFSVHALNNYLTVTKGAVELLLWSLEGHPNPQIRIWLQALGHVTDLMRHTAGQMIPSSSPKDVKLQFLKWDLAPLARRTCDYYQRVADRKNISIICESPPDIAPVWTDPVAVAAVMDNLLSNAVKYSFPGKRIWVQLRADTTSVVCSVCDEGPGLSREDQAKLFQRGTRLNSLATGGESSSGYGLAVARELIERLEGDLWCESSSGAGACFSFRLPVYQEQHETK
jgi:signal transduction histidine kinase